MSPILRPWEGTREGAHPNPRLNKPHLCRSKEEFIRFAQEAHDLGAFLVVSPLLFSQMIRWPGIRDVMHPFEDMEQLRHGVIGTVGDTHVIADRLRPIRHRVQWPDDMPMVSFQKRDI